MCFFSAQGHGLHTCVEMLAPTRCVKQWLALLHHNYFLSVVFEDRGCPYVYFIPL